MISQAELKRVRALQQKKHREESGRVLVQGRKVVAELLGSTWRTQALYASDEAAAWIGKLAKAHSVPVHVLPDFELDRIGTFEVGNELVAVAIAPAAPKFRPPIHGELMLALDGIHDPRNMGGLLRIADWFGVKRVVCSPDCMEVCNPKCVQSTMGSLFRVEVRYTELAPELSGFVGAGAAVFLADMGGASAFEMNLLRPAVLVLGSESHGISPAVRDVKSTVVSIPRIGGAESLNVAMAAAALCSEFARQVSHSQAG